MELVWTSHMQAGLMGIKQPLWYKQQTRPAAVLLRYFTFYMDFYNPGRGKPRSMPSLSAGQV